MRSSAALRVDEVALKCAIPSRSCDEGETASWRAGELASWRAGARPPDDDHYFRSTNVSTRRLGLTRLRSGPRIAAAAAAARRNPAETRARLQTSCSRLSSKRSHSQSRGEAIQMNWPPPPPRSRAEHSPRKGWPKRAHAQPRRTSARETFPNRPLGRAYDDEHEGGPTRRGHTSLAAPDESPDMILQSCWAT